jgi:malate synthase
MQSNLTLNRRAFYLPHVHIFAYHTVLVNKFNPCLLAFISQKSVEKRQYMFVIYSIETWQEVFVWIKICRILNSWIDLPTKTTKIRAPRIKVILQ